MSPLLSKTTVNQNVAYIHPANIVMVMLGLVCRKHMALYICLAFMMVQQSNSEKQEAVQSIVHLSSTCCVLGSLIFQEHLLMQIESQDIVHSQRKVC